ncbi:MAG: SigE family RNA polymerase sigma factor [Kineosporiaceae bacterium]
MAGPPPSPLDTLEDLYRRQWSPMVRLAAMLTGDASVAEEIVQESFVRLHASWSRLREPEAAVGYLRTSVVNASRSSLRHRVVVERFRPLPAPAPAGPEESAVQSARDAEVMAAVRALPRRQREVVVLRFVADLSEREIAAALGISTGSVKSHSARAMAALRDVLAAAHGRDGSASGRDLTNGREARDE